MKNSGPWVLMTAVAMSGALMAATASAQVFHHRNNWIGIAPCLAVANSTQRTAIRQQFAGNRQTLMTDRDNVMKARQALTSAILSGPNPNLSSEESAVISAEQQLLHDQDAFEVAACGQLSSKQLSAAKTLHETVLNVHENARQQIHKAFQAAQSAAGNGNSSAPEPEE